MRRVSGNSANVATGEGEDHKSEAVLLNAEDEMMIAEHGLDSSDVAKDENVE